jgi:hypothetical protein
VLVETFDGKNPHPFGSFAPSCEPVAPTAVRQFDKWRLAASVDRAFDPDEPSGASDEIPLKPSHPMTKGALPPPLGRPPAMPRRDAGIDLAAESTKR